MTENLIPLGVLILALAGKARSVAIGACVLLLLQLLGAKGSLIQDISPALGTIGLALLIVQTMSPLVSEGNNLQSLGRTILTPLGAFAFAASMFTTYLSGRGYVFINQPHNAALFVPLMLGSILSATLFKGLPVGPFITAGILSLVAGLLGNAVK